MRGCRGGIQSQGLDPRWRPSEFSEAAVGVPCKPSEGFIGALTKAPDRHELLQQVRAARAVYVKARAKLDDSDRNHKSSRKWDHLAFRAAYEKYDEIATKCSWFKSPEGGLKWDGDLDTWILEEDFVETPVTPVTEDFTGHSSAR